jgi:hypothetical protein
MSTPTTPPDNLISEAALDALVREMGLVGMVLYLQQISPGKGDYTAERQQPDSLAYEDFRELGAKIRAENGRCSAAITSTISETEEKILRAGYSALYRELGPVGMIGFIQQISRGKRDYTAERQQREPISFAGIEERLAWMRAANARQSEDEQAS